MDFQTAVIMAKKYQEENLERDITENEIENFISHVLNKYFIEHTTHEKYFDMRFSAEHTRYSNFNYLRLD